MSEFIYTRAPGTDLCAATPVSAVESTRLMLRSMTLFCNDLGEQAGEGTPEALGMSAMSDVFTAAAKGLTALEAHCRRVGQVGDMSDHFPGLGL